MLAADVGTNLGLSIDLRGETGEEEATLWAGDYFLDRVFLTTEWRRYDLDLIRDAGLEPQDVRVEFTNDLYAPDSGIDRNVFVGSLFLNGETIDPNTQDAFSTGTWLADDGIAPGLGRGSVLNTNGYLQFGAPTGSVLTVYARGNEGGEAFVLEAGSRKFEPITVTNELQAYEFFLNETIDPGSVRVSFINDLYLPNDGVDFNLTVDRIELDGTDYEAEGSDVLHAGFFSDELGLATGFFATETIHANGYFQFDAKVVDSERYAFDGSVSGDGLIELAPGNIGNVAGFSDGSFVAISERFAFGLPDVASPVFVEAFDPSGNIDPTFNNGSSLDLLPTIDAATDFSVRAVTVDSILVDSQDRALIAINANGTDQNGSFVFERQVIRLTRTGDLDASFGNGGVIDLGNERIDVFAIDSLDRLVGASDNVIVRLDNVGQFDSSFGNGGTQTLNRPAGDALVEDIAIRNDRSIAVLLNREFALEGDNGYVLQLNEDGSAGTWFGDNGVATVPRQFFSSSSIFTEKYREFALDDSGRLVLRSQRSLLRITVNGQLDYAFGDFGVTKFPQDILSDGAFFAFGSESGPVIDDQGRIIVSVGGGFAAVNDSGQFDTSFSFDGFAPTPNLGDVSFDGGDLQFDVSGRLFSHIRTRTGGPAIAVWELV